MRIEVIFQFKKDLKPIASTGVEDGVTDLLLPATGDLVSHQDTQGRPFTGKVAERAFLYNLPSGTDIHGSVTVTLYLDQVMMH